MPDPVIGAHTYGRPQVIQYDPETTCTIGKYCSIAGHVVVLLGGEHRTDTATTFPLAAMGMREADEVAPNAFTKGDIVIGNDVWIGEGAKILGGVHIGNGAVVGAYAVVARDVPAYAIVTGNPAEVRHYRFSARVCAQLQKIAWWDWEDKQVKEAAPLLAGAADEFVKVYGGETTWHL